MPGYLTVKSKARAAFSVEGSRFMATLAPAALEADALEFVNTVREEFDGATHNTYAFRVGAHSGPVERCSDDREPAGTAGLPMLQVLRGRGILNIVLVATRYFGGIKLGIGGLTRAYRECARAVLEQAELVERERTSACVISVLYSEQGSLARYIQSAGGEIISVSYGEVVAVTAVIPFRHAQTLEDALADLTRGRGRINWK